MTPDEFHEALHSDVGRPRQELQVRYAGKYAFKQLVQEPGAHRAPWAFANVNVQTRTVKVQVNLNLKKSDLSSQDYVRLKNLVLRGIRTYWSRTIGILRQAFAVDVTAVENVQNGVEVDLVIEKGPKYGRSHNIGLLGVDASFIYNSGYFPSSTDADQDFMLTAAHEFGHTVLMEFGGIGTSWTHKGSTHLWQSVKGSTPGYPQSGEIDLMKYYDDAKNAVGFTRQVTASRASEFDIKCMLWMSTLSF